MAKPERKSMRDRIKAQAHAASTEGASYIKTEGKVNFFQPKAEEYELDVIPFENNNPNHPLGYEVGDLIPFVRFKVHSGIGAEESRYVCPTSIGKKCPICEVRSKMAKSSSSDPDVIKALNAKDRMLFNVSDLAEEKKGIQLFDHSFHLFGKKLMGDIEKTENSASSRKRSTAHAGFAELVGGQTLIATFVEKKMGPNKFYECDRIDAENRDDYADDILDDVINLDECLKILDYDELKAIFLEIDPEDQGSGRKDKEDEGSGRKRGGRTAPPEDEPEEKPSRRRGAAKEEPEDAPEEKPTRRRGAPVEEPVEEKPTRRRGAAPPVEEPEDAPEEKPTRRRGATPPPVEEEPPTRTRRGAAPAKSECWVEGGVFGKDCDTHTGPEGTPNCFDCPQDIWKRCKAEQIRLEEAE